MRGTLTCALAELVAEIRRLLDRLVAFTSSDKYSMTSLRFAPCIGFRRVIARRGVRDVDQWLDGAEACELSVRRPLNGIQADRAPVVNGLTLPWSPGPV
jgi:hypothetical protein